LNPWQQAESTMYLVIKTWATEFPKTRDFYIITSDD
jgi:hypothetical protein